MQTVHVLFTIITKIELCDTGGMERYNTLSVSYFTAASAVIICYSLVDRASFSAVRYHLAEAVDNASRRNGVGFGGHLGRSTSDGHKQQHHRDSRPPVAIFLCGTKSDLLVNDSPMAEDTSLKAVRL